MKTAEEYIAEYTAAGQTPQALCKIYAAMEKEVVDRMSTSPVVTDASAATILDEINAKWEAFAHEAGVNPQGFAIMQKYRFPRHFRRWMEIREGAGKFICV